MDGQSDSVMRAMTDDGGLRVIAAVTTETVQGLIDAQKATGETARILAELAIGTILIRETMAPNQRVQGIVQAPGGRGVLVADSHPDGATRALLRRPADGSEVTAVGEGMALQMMRTLPNGMQHSGVVAVPPEGGVSAALMEYLQTSEQVVSVIAVGVVLDGAKVLRAGGYLVQLLPELNESQLAIMTARLGEFPSIETLLANEGKTPDGLIEELLYRMPHSRLADSPLGYGCQCSEIRVMASLATLPRHEIEQMVNDGKTLEIGCDYCGTQYAVEVERLRGLLTPS